MVVEVGDSVHGVDDKQDYVGLLDGEFDLFVDFRLEDVFRVYHPTAGIDYRELVAGPVNLAVLPVAGCAGGGVGDGGA